MEPDELKLAWQSLQQSLQRQDALQSQLFRDNRLDKARGSLRPLFWGQLAQMLLFGLPFLLLASLLWYRGGHLSAPLPLPTLLAGIAVHAYAVAVIVLSGCTLGLIRRIDYAAPVLEIQKQLGRLRRLYVVNGMVAGLPWWLLWVPVLMVLSGLSGVDLYARAPSLAWIGIGIGIAGLFATWAFHRWSRSPKRPKLARAMEDSVTGSSLRKARQALDEIARFERD